MCVMKLTFGKNIFLQIFLKFQIQFEASRRTYFYVQTSAVLPYVVLVVAVRMVKWHVRTGSLQV